MSRNRKIVLPIKNLTPRQWKLYELIKKNSFDEHRKTTQKEICEKIPKIKNTADGFHYLERSGATEKCAAIWDDIQIINLYEGIDKFIITKKYEYWIGSQAECEAYADALWNSFLSPKLQRYKAIVKKMKMNNQGKILSHAGKVVGESSKAERFIQAFNDFDIELNERR